MSFEGDSAFDVLEGVLAFSDFTGVFSFAADCCPGIDVLDGFLVALGGPDGVIASTVAALVGSAGFI